MRKFCKQTQTGKLVSVRKAGLPPLFVFLSCILLNITCFSQAKDYTRWVNPFIGTGGHGHTFPGATMPFGMVQLSPDTRTDNWDGSSGYHYSDDIIYGFSHTHLSGTGIPDGCDILFMPTIIDYQFPEKAREKYKNHYASKFSHANEKAEPGYYSVKLDDDNILAEMAATTRVGMHRYTFPKSDKSNVILDLNWRDKVVDYQIKVVGDNRIEGYRRSASWAKDQQVFFVAEFSKPFAGYSLQGKSESFSEGTTHTVMYDDAKMIKGIFSFKTAGSEEIMLKVALSPVSIEGARKNLAAELPGWDFDKVRADAKAAWNKELSKIEVSGGTEAQTTTFYTALYHTMIHPNVFNDVDGRYRGHDGKVHQLPDAEERRGEEEKRRSGEKPKTKDLKPKAEHFTVFSLWDTFRAAHPLYTIIDQRRTVDFINTFIRIYEQGGRLPVWELWGEETDTMIGYHAVSVIADAMAKGIKGFDYEKAYAAAKHSAELDHDGLAAYKRRGYISMEDENESVSKTLEYAYDDWCIAVIARELCNRTSLAVCDRHGPPEWPFKIAFHPDAAIFAQRAANYENLFDSQTGFMRPRKNGGWVSPFQPNEVTFNYTEGNAWQYSFFVPQDILGLIELYGGRTKFEAKLDELFTTTDKLAGREQPDITGLIGQYAHGNEPSHHITYLFNFADKPSKTQKYVRQILDEFYKPTPDGLIGNEDCGQMSAWYVLSAMGFYQVTPGDPHYEIGTPIFKEAKINLENGKSFIIRAPNVTEKNIYVKSKKLNGRELIWATGFEHEDMMRGGVLELEMTSEPVSLNMPYGIIDRKRSTLRNVIVAVPVISSASRVFTNGTSISISSNSGGADIFYTLDGSVPTTSSTKYIAPFNLDSSAVVKAIAVRGNMQSLITEASLLKKPNDWTVKIDSKYNRQYTGGGDDGLIDGMRGTTNFASGEWQGYQGQDFVATIDLQKETSISKVGGGFLQTARSWIWMPTHIEFEISTDGVNFTRVADIKTDIAPEDMDSKIRDYVQTISPTKARYVRVHAFNLGKIPAWHPGAGFDAFIFVDELFVR